MTGPVGQRHEILGCYQHLLRPGRHRVPRHESPHRRSHRTCTIIPLWLHASREELRHESVPLAGFPPTSPAATTWRKHLAVLLDTLVLNFGQRQGSGKIHFAAADDVDVPGVRAPAISQQETAA